MSLTETKPKPTSDAYIEVMSELVWPVVLAYQLLLDAVDVTNDRR